MALIIQAVAGEVFLSCSCSVCSALSSFQPSWRGWASPEPCLGLAPAQQRPFVAAWGWREDGRAWGSLPAQFCSAPSPEGSSVWHWHRWPQPLQALPWPCRAWAEMAPACALCTHQGSIVPGPLFFSLCSFFSFFSISCPEL